MRSRDNAPRVPLVLREARVLLARWHVWAALAVAGVVQAAALHSAALLEGARPALVVALGAAWLCALPVVLACGAAEDRGASVALLIQLGHGPARVTLAKASAGLVGAVLLALPTGAALLVLAMHDATVTIPVSSLLTLLLGAALAGALALFWAALVQDSGWAALVTLLSALGALWLDEQAGLFGLMSAARAGTVALFALAQLAVGTGTLLALASIWSSPVASGERRAVRSAIVLAIGAALLLAAGRLPGELSSTAALDVRARAAEAMALGELGGAASVMGALFLLVGMAAAWRRRG